jgi:hypothetical protein
LLDYAISNLNGTGYKANIEKIVLSNFHSLKMKPKFLQLNYLDSNTKKVETSYIIIKLDIQKLLLLVKKNIGEGRFKIDLFLNTPNLIQNQGVINLLSNHLKKSSDESKLILKSIMIDSVRIYLTSNCMPSNIDKISLFLNQDLNCTFFQQNFINNSTDFNYFVDHNKIEFRYFLNFIFIILSMQSAHSLGLSYQSMFDIICGLTLHQTKDNNYIFSFPSVERNDIIKINQTVGTFFESSFITKYDIVKEKIRLIISAKDTSLN